MLTVWRHRTLYAQRRCTAAALFATEHHVFRPAGFSFAAFTCSGQQRRLFSTPASATEKLVRLIRRVRGRCSGADKSSFRGEGGKLSAETEDKLISYSLIIFPRPFSSPSAEVICHPHANYHILL